MIPQYTGGSFTGIPNYTNAPVGAMNPQGVQLQSMSSPSPVSSPMQLGFQPGVVGNPGAPQIGAGGGSETGLGWNMGTAELALGGVQTLAGIWNAWQANKLAREQFDFTKGITKDNLRNSIQSYNTTLSDRINSRAFTEGRPEGYAKQYIDENRLSSTMV